MEKKGFFDNATVAGVIAGAVTYGLPKLENANATWIPDWLRQFGGWWGTPIGIEPYKILLAVVAVYLLWRAVKRVRGAMQAPAPAKETAPFLSYRKDRYLSVDWEWGWERGLDNKYVPADFRPFCPKCHYPLVWEAPTYAFTGEHTVICEKCGFWHDFEFRKEGMEERLVREIAHMVRESHRTGRGAPTNNSLVPNA